MGHLVEAAGPPVTEDGHTLIMLEPAGAVEAPPCPHQQPFAVPLQHDVLSAALSPKP